jgi:hypothetical protein
MAATQTTKGTTFVVHLDGVDIPEKERAVLARSIQSAALSELARLDLGGGMTVRFPLREWWGLWLERLAGRELPIPRVTVDPRGGR